MFYSWIFGGNNANLSVVYFNYFLYGCAEGANNVMSLKLMYITNNKNVAGIADKNGVDRVWVDLETLGKEERQKGLNTVKSHHRISDIAIIKPVLKNAEMLVRVNPINENSKEEIEKVIQNGADNIMLPMFKTKDEVEKFLNYINGRTKNILLLETKEAVENLDEILSVSGINEVHIGLNDLHLAYKRKFMFELLTDGLVDKICGTLKQKNLKFGFGGIARIGQGILPAENILTEHYRLGSQAVILSRSFCNYERKSLEEIEKVFNTEVNRVREYEKMLLSFTKTDFDNNRLKIIKLVHTIVSTAREH